MPAFPPLRPVLSYSFSSPHGQGSPFPSAGRSAFARFAAVAAGRHHASSYIELRVRLEHVVLRALLLPRGSCTPLREAELSLRGCSRAVPLSCSYFLVHCRSPRLLRT